MSNRPRRRDRSGRRLSDELMAELRRRAETSKHTDPRRLGGSVSGPGGPHDRGMVVADMTDCVLLDGSNVCTVDMVRMGELQEQAIYMVLEGRINKTADRAMVGYVFGPDGAAALITQLLALATRHGVELLDDMTRRLTEMHQGREVDLHWLRAAIDIVLEDPDNAPQDPPIP